MMLVGPAAPLAGLPNVSDILEPRAIYSIDSLP